MRNMVDVVVVGAGINGMVAAAMLAKRGRSVCLIEGRERIGGFIASDAVSDPGYIHDQFSSFQPLFSTGLAFGFLGEDLRRHGLTHVNIDAPDAPLFASAGGDGRITVAYRDAGVTADSFSDPADRTAYRTMLDRSARSLDIVGKMLGEELRDPRRVLDAIRLSRRLSLPGIEGLVRDAAMNGRAAIQRQFVGREVDHLWSPWLLHAGLSPDAAGGGLMLPVFAHTLHGGGLPIVRGGARYLVSAFESLLDELGVDVITGTTVNRILVDSGRAVGVEAGSRHIIAREAIVASVLPGPLYGGLLADVEGLEREREEARLYRYGRGAMQLHFALDAPPAWRQEALGRTPVIHLSSGSASTGIACAEAEAGLLPRRPTIVVGQQYVIDSTRAPAGAAQLWIQMHEAPYAPVGDSAGEIDTSRGWTDEVAGAYVERVLDLIEEHAPGLRRSIVSRHVMTPVDLERENPNAARGDAYGGSLELDQNLIWRPGPRTARHQTTVNRLWHIGSATHPGPGLAGASGLIAAMGIARRRKAVDTSGRSLAGRRQRHAEEMS